MSDGQSGGSPQPAPPPEPPGETHPGEAPAKPTGRYLALLSLGALGVVYGDIGTSPIYAFRQSLNPGQPLAAIAPNVMGILSLIFWALVIIIAIKYQLFVLRANNRGEGGILALTWLISSPTRSPEHSPLLLLGLFGGALL